MVPVRKQEIEVGKPLPYTIYDANRNLLLRAGTMVVSEHQVEALVEKGMFRERKRSLVPRGLDFPDPVVTDDVAVNVVAAIPHAVAEQGPASPQPQTILASLDDAKLMPGDALQLQPLLEGALERYTVKVIGMMKHRSLLVTAPEADGKLLFVRDGQPFQVRAFSGLNVCAFKTKVLKAHHTPFPYLHLAYPDRVEIMRIRKSVRAAVNLICAISEQDGGRQIAAGRIVDLSTGGVRVHSSMSYGDKDATVFLSFKIKLDEVEEYVNVAATIRAAAEEADDHGKPVHSVGLQFEGLNQHDRLLIMNLVYQYLLKEHR